MRCSRQQRNGSDSLRDNRYRQSPCELDQPGASPGCPKQQWERRPGREHRSHKLRMHGPFGHEVRHVLATFLTLNQTDLHRCHPAAVPVEINMRGLFASTNMAPQGLAADPEHVYRLLAPSLPVCYSANKCCSNAFIAMTHWNHHISLDSSVLQVAT